jgi:hypothetical protein
MIAELIAEFGIGAKLVWRLTFKQSSCDECLKMGATRAGIDGGFRHG